MTNIAAIRRAVAEHKVELDELGVASLAVFGSVARDEAGPGAPGELTRRLQELFFAIVRGKEERYRSWLAYL